MTVLSSAESLIHDEESELLGRMDQRLTESGETFCC